MTNDIVTFSAVNCTDSPPERPESGTWEWNGGISYDTRVTYTCGPYGGFESPEGNTYKVIDSVCGWNKSWVPSVLDPCVATSCQVIPFPPPETGMVFQQDPENPITLQSEFNVYNPRLPMDMGFPADFCGDNGDIMMIVGSVPTKSRKPLEIIFMGANGWDESFHMLVDIPNDVVKRWAVLDNETLEMQGEDGEGTTIDHDEPFVIM